MENELTREKDKLEKAGHGLSDYHKKFGELKEIYNNLNPDNEKGKLIFIVRLGAKNIKKVFEY